jgi:hypothetical protein
VVRHRVGRAFSDDAARSSAEVEGLWIDMNSARFAVG